MSTTKGMEVKKDGLSQLQDGSWVFKFKVNPLDIPTALLTAPMGTRYMAALVEIGDDEQPVIRPKENISLSQEAAMYCARPNFRKFLSEITNNKQVLTAEAAATIIRADCFVTSRSQFDIDNDAANRWIAMRGNFKAWELN